MEALSGIPNGFCWRPSEGKGSLVENIRSVKK